MTQRSFRTLFTFVGVVVGISVVILCWIQQKQQRHLISAVPSIQRALAHHDDVSSLSSSTSSSSSTQRPLVIMLGLPRSGSLALHEFFTCHGWSSVHYCAHPWQEPNNPASNRTTGFPCGRNVPTVGQLVHDNIHYGRSPFHGIGQGQQSPTGDEQGHLIKTATGAYDVYAQFDVETSEPFAYFLPQHYALPFLYEAYAAADTTDATGRRRPVVWILNTRDTAERWADNVMHWHSVTQRMLRSWSGTDRSTVAGNRVAPWGNYKGKVMRQALTQSIARRMGIAIHQKRRQQMVWFYQNHTERILHYYQSRLVNLPGNQFIQLNVDDPTAGHVLEQALGLNVSTTTLSSSSSCWKFNSKALDDDWRDLTLRV